MDTTTRSEATARRTAALTILVGLFLVLAALFIVSAPAARAASTDVGGPITTPTTWTQAGSPYVVTETVIVQGGGVLTIEAGVEVRFNASTGLRIRTGPLVIQGTATQPVTLTANSGAPAAGFWGGIAFDTDTPQTSTLDYCLVEYAATGIAFGDSDGHSIRHCTLRDNGDGGGWNTGGAINSSGDGLTISYNDIYSNELGLRLTKAYGYTISDNRIHDNAGFGIGFIAANSPGGGNNLVSSNEIYANGGYGLGFVPQGIYEGGNDNVVSGNEIYANVAANTLPGNGLHLNTGANNVLLANHVFGNEANGVWLRAQSMLTVTGNVVQANGGNGVAFDATSVSPLAFHSNVMCGNTGFELGSAWPGSLLAEGNWFGTNTPASGAEVLGNVDFAPWISLTATVSPTALPADGTSTAALTVTMSSGAYAVPDGYTVTVAASEGAVAPSPVALVGGTAPTTYTAGHVPGGVDFTLTDLCTTLTFTNLLTLEAVDLLTYKVGPGGTARPGDVVTFTLVISEVSGVNAPDVVLTDVLPFGTAWLTDTSAACSLSRTVLADRVVWTAPLWPGDSGCWFDVALLVQPAACQQLTLTNQVVVTSSVTDWNLSNNDHTTGRDSPGMACLDLAVSKTASGLIVGPNKEYFVEYTITVSNTEPATITGAVLTDVLPIGTTYAGSGWTCPGGTTCTRALGDLPPTSTLAVSLPVQLDVSALGCPIVLTNTVRVGSPDDDQDPSDNVFTLTSRFECLPDLVVVKNDNVGGLQAGAERVYEMLNLPPAEPEQECVYPGEWITYTIAYVNAGLETASGVVLTETLPQHTSYAGSGWTPAGGNTYTRSVGSLAPNQGGVAHFAVQVDTAPPDLIVENEVRIGGAEDDLHPPDNVSTDDTPICEGLRLYVSKDDDTPCAFPGDEIRYTIVYTNPSGETASGVVLTETLPAHTRYLTSAGWLPLGGGQFAHAVGDLAPYATGSIEFAVLVDDPLPGTVTQTTNVVCLGYQGPPLPGNCFSLVTPLPVEPDLRVVKHDHVGPPPPLDVQRDLDRFYRQLYSEPYQPAAASALWEPVRPGDVYSYTITYLNLGRAPIGGVVLTETLPQHTTYVGYGWSPAGGNAYTRSVGSLAPGTGGEATIYLQVGAVPCNGDDYLYNWVHIGGDATECNVDNNWSGEETPVECQGYGVYLPVILRNPLPPIPPEPTPEPPGEGYVSDVDVNPETNRVYVASPPLNAILAVDPSGAGSVVDTIPVGDHPLGVAVVTTTNKIYAANLNSWTVTAIRGSDHTVINDLYAGAQACKLVADHADGRVYVTNHLESDNGAAAINSQTDEFLYYYTRLHATQGRYGIALDPDAEKLFIAARDAGLIAIQDAFYPNQEPLLFKLDPPRVPFVADFNPATGHLFVSAADDNGLQSRVVVLDPYSIEWTKGRWVIIRGWPVFLLEKSNAGWIAEIGVGLNAEEGIAVNPRTGYVYVSNGGSDTVSVLRDDADPAQIGWVRDVAVGYYPQGVAVDVTRNLIYVGNAGSRTLSVIDGATHTVVKTIPLE